MAGVDAVQSAFWISHMRRDSGDGHAVQLKLPSTTVLPRAVVAALPCLRSPPVRVMHGTVPGTFQEVWTSVHNGVGYLNFDFLDGSFVRACDMRCECCRRCAVPVLTVCRNGCHACV
jgi:hypothetical protein